jgi:hypothetical protein
MAEKLQGPDDIRRAIRGFIENPGQSFYSTQSDSGSSETDDDTIASRIGATVKKLKDGTRQPMTKTARNPMLETPSVMGQRYFGQHQSFRVAMDSVFAKMIGVFPKPQQGAGVSAFNFSNMSQFGGGGMQLTDALATMVMGGDTSTLASGTSPMAASINNLTSQIASLAGALPHSIIDLSRPDHAIPFMQAASQVFSGSSTPVFDGSVFSASYHIAADVQRYLTDQSGGVIQYSSVLAQIGQSNANLNIAQQTIIILTAARTLSAGLSPSDLAMIIALVEELQLAPSYAIQQAKIISLANQLTTTQSASGELQNYMNAILIAGGMTTGALGVQGGSGGNSGGSGGLLGSLSGMLSSGAFNSSAISGLAGGSGLGNLGQAGGDQLNSLGVSPNQQAQMDQQQAQQDQQNQGQQRIVGRLKDDPENEKILGTMMGDEKVEYKDNPDE